MRESERASGWVNEWVTEWVRDHCDQWALVQLYISCREHVTFQWHDDDDDDDILFVLNKHTRNYLGIR